MPGAGVPALSSAKLFTSFRVFHVGSVAILNTVNQDSPYDAPVLRSDGLANTIQRAEQEPVRAIEIQGDVAA
jgi:hypothetical protein